MGSLKEIKIGCCGWSYDDWKGVFYPKDAKAGEYLQCYAERFDIVEVDSTFYRIPSKRMVEGWRDKTPDGFQFALKMTRDVTHDKMLRDCDDERDAFLDAARLLGDKLHCVCLQFGYFNKKKFASLKQFLELLDPFLASWPIDVQIAVEIRNKNWIGEEWVETLKKHQAAMVLVQQTWMPPPGVVVEKFGGVTGPFGYVRLLGDRKGIEEITTEWSKAVVDKTDEIKRTASAIRKIAENVPVVAFCNNHYAGFGPGTAETLAKSLRR